MFKSIILAILLLPLSALGAVNTSKNIFSTQDSPLTMNVVFNSDNNISKMLVKVWFEVSFEKTRFVSLQMIAEPVTNGATFPSWLIGGDIDFIYDKGTDKAAVPASTSAYDVTKYGSSGALRFIFPDLNDEDWRKLVRYRLREIMMITETSNPINFINFTFENIYPTTNFLFANINTMAISKLTGASSTSMCNILAGKGTFWELTNGGKAQLDGKFSLQVSTTGFMQISMGAGKVAHATNMTKKSIANVRWATTCGTTPFGITWPELLVPPRNTTVISWVDETTDMFGRNNSEVALYYIKERNKFVALYKYYYNGKLNSSYLFLSLFTNNGEEICNKIINYLSSNGFKKAY